MKGNTTKKLIADIFEAITMYQAHSSNELNTIIKGLGEMMEQLGKQSKEWAKEDLPEHIEIPWIVTNMMPYIVISTYTDDADKDATTSYPYCLYAESEEQVYEKVKSILVYDEIEEQHYTNGGDSENNLIPFGHYENPNPESYQLKYYPITWDAIDARNRNNERGYAITKPILLDHLIKQTTMELIK